MDVLSEITAKEKLALLNREIDMCEKERDNLLYEYRLLKDNVRHMKKHAIPRLLVISIYLIINRAIRIWQVAEIYKHVGESRLVMVTVKQRIFELLTDQHLLLFLFIILGIYFIILGIRFYAMFAKTEHSLVPVRVASIINVRNYSMELTSIEAKIRNCDLELQNLKHEAEQVLFDTINQMPV